jgi:hypothetical protein
MLDLFQNQTINRRWQSRKVATIKCIIICGSYKVAKKIRTLLGSIVHEEDRMKLFLRVKDPVVVVEVVVPPMLLC